METTKKDARVEQDAGTNAAGMVPTSVGTGAYLRKRPTLTTRPPLDDRMAKSQRWVNYSLKQNTDPNKKPGKIPSGNSDKPASWTFFHAARVALGDPRVAGLGFQMGPLSDGSRPDVVGIDLDNCLDPDTGTRTPEVEQLFAMLQAAGGRYHVEITPSGKGFRIFAAKTELPFHDYTNKDNGFEVYTGEKGRFLTFTGALVPEFADYKRLDPLPQEAVEFLGKRATAGKWKQGAARADGAAEPVPATEPVPDLTRRDDWRKLHPQALKRLSKEHREFLETGALGKKYASASEQLFAVEQALLKHLKPAQAFQILVSAEGTWGLALEHREGKGEKARAYLWDDVNRAALSKEKFEKEEASTASGWKECGISVFTTQDGSHAVYGVNNMALVLTNRPEWKGRIRLNLFKERIELDGATFEEEALPSIAEKLRAYLRWDQEPRLDHVHKAVAVAAKAQAYHPVQEMLRSYKWDGEKRLDDWLVRAGCEDGEVARAVGQKWLLSLVARALRPGCKCDTVLILEGPQGRKKSTLFRTLAGGADFFTDTCITLDKDGLMAMHGHWVIELAELATFQKAEQLRTKQFLTGQDLTFRAPYGRITVTRPRHFVLVGTTNDEEYFTDRTGNRRYWPVRVKADKLDLKWLTEAREQLLAEAVVAFDAGEPWWFDVEPVALEEARDARTESNPLTERVQAFVVECEKNGSDASERQFAIEKVMDRLDLPIENKRLVMEVADALRSLGLKKRREMVDGVRAWRWYKPEWPALVQGAGTGSGGSGGAPPLALVKDGQEAGQDQKVSNRP